MNWWHVLTGLELIVAAWWLWRVVISDTSSIEIRMRKEINDKLEALRKELKSQPSSDGIQENRWRDMHGAM